MPDYKEGKIYKIVCNITAKIYIGSTIQSLSVRLAAHRVGYKSFKVNKSSYTTSYQIIEQGNYDIVLVENYPCKSKDELHRRERHFIESLDCVNKIIPSRTVKEWYADNKEHVAKRGQLYREAHQEHYAKIKAEYWEDNREHLTQYYTQYAEANKEYLIQYSKQYREANREKIRERENKKVKCECGCEVNNSSMTVHKKSNKHHCRMAL